MADLQELHQQFQKLQGEMLGNIEKKRQLDAQLNECTMVKDELDALKEEEPVYKMHGKVLIRQDTAEARSTISARQKFIQAEQVKLERVLATLQPQRDAVRDKIMEAQARARAAAPAGGSA